MKGIITADWHLRATKPRCRTDSDWIKTQRIALEQIVEIADEKNAPVFVVGDLFHSNSDTSFDCISMVQKMATELDGLYILAGNHDLPYHSSENIDKSAIGVLLNSYDIYPIAVYCGGISASNFDEEDNYTTPIVFKHTLTIPKKDIPPMVECETPESLLDKFPKAKWIFTGDYHHNFHYEDNGRHVVNSGCLLRQVADMKDYQCGVYFVDTDEDVCEFIPIKDEASLVDDTYILKSEERNERIVNFAEKLKEMNGDISLDFEDNVRKSLSVNRFSKELVETIESLMGC